MVAYLERLIERGAPGDALPSTRALCRELSTSPVTVGRAVAALAARGRVRSEPGRGVFIAAGPRTEAASTGWQSLALAPSRVDGAAVRFLDPVGVLADRVPLSSGYLGADLHPRAALQGAASRSIRRGSVWEPAPAAGLGALRAVFAHQATVDESEVLVTNGSQSAIALIAQAVAAPGDAVIVESPTYPGALAALRAAGLRPIPVPTDARGVDPVDMDAAFARTGARLAYLQSAVNNPTGLSLHPERRRPLLEVARRHRALVVDDDWARHIRLDAPVPPPLIADDVHGHVIHISSLAKPVAPSLRVGFLAARGPVLARLHTAVVTNQLFVARPLQEIALEFLTSAEWPRHTGRLSRTLVARRDALLAQVRRVWSDGDVTPPRAGFHLWLACPRGVEPGALARDAQRAGITIGDGDAYFAGEPAEPRIRISFSATSERQAADALVTLASVRDGAAVH